MNRGSPVPDAAGSAALLKDVNGGECLFGNEVLCGSQAGGAGADDGNGPDGVWGHGLICGIGKGDVVGCLVLGKRVSWCCFRWRGFWEGEKA